jgi:hypothetical protein
MTYYELNMNSQRITSCQDPSGSQDVATKNYVDTKQVVLQSWTTENRPNPPVNYTMGYNTTLSKIDFYNGSIWTQLANSLQQFQGGNQVVPDLYTLMTSMINKADANPTFGGSLTINSVLVGNYDYTIKVGNQAINSFITTDYFTTTADSAASLICIDGNLTINSGVLFTPSVRKLFTCIYVDGDLNVIGNVSMSARGANTSALAVQTANIRLITGTYSGVLNPQVPGAGGDGGAGGSNATASNGTSGSNGATGGGGGGGAYISTGGSGSQGSSFSGGCGGGGSNSGIGNVNATGFGGIGGTGRNVNGGNKSSGGTGNPGGPSIDNNGNINEATGTSGTGGTLIIYVTGSLSGSGTISCNGVDGLVDSGVIGGGGGSGGGSLTIICNNNTSTTTRTATGGAGGIGWPSPPYNQYGGAGGNGSVRLLTGL